MTRVLVAVDESEDSVKAAETARTLFGPDAEFLAVNVARDDVPWTRGYRWGYVWPYTTFPPPVYGAPAMHEPYGAGEKYGPRMSAATMAESVPSAPPSAPAWRTRSRSPSSVIRVTPSPRRPKSITPT